jgi:hypothetical protein
MAVLHPLAYGRKLPPKAKPKTPQQLLTSLPQWDLGPNDVKPGMYDPSLDWQGQTEQQGFGFAQQDIHDRTARGVRGFRGPALSTRPGSFRRSDAPDTALGTGSGGLQHPHRGPWSQLQRTSVSLRENARGRQELRKAVRWLRRFRSARRIRRMTRLGSTRRGGAFRTTRTPVQHGPQRCSGRCVHGHDAGRGGAHPVRCSSWVARRSSRRSRWGRCPRPRRRG